MQTWKWLYDPESPYHWRFLLNVVVRAMILFVALNLIFVLANPLPLLGRISVYNTLLDGRERLPYGENPEASYSLSLYQIDAMFASHELAGTDKDAEYRVLLIGDSSVWGILLEPESTLAGQINQGNYRTAGGKRVHAYNLGYPTMSLVKDLMLLDYAMRYEPDLIVWMLTLESFNQAAQLDPALVQNNPDRVRDLIEEYDLNQDPNDPRFVDLSSWDKTIIGRRRDLADLLRLQFYGVAWAVTGIDQEYPEDYARLTLRLPEHDQWQDYTEKMFDTDEREFAEVLAFDVLVAGSQRAGDTPVLFINEPTFMSKPESNPHYEEGNPRYSYFYPRWAYDQYRQLLGEQADELQWQYRDLAEAIPEAECYTDSPVHLTPECSARLGNIVGPAIVQMGNVGMDLAP